MNLELGQVAFRRIADIMYQAVGLTFNDNKKSLMSSRLAARVQRLGLDSFDAYAALLADESEATEFQVAVDLLTTNETYFFREPKHFDALEQHLTGRRNTGAVTVWSAASSFGDEAYSIAMLMADLQTGGRIDAGWSILATDISHRVLLSAKEAVYPMDRLRMVSPERLKRYCLKGEDESRGLVQIQSKITQRVRFGQLNLMLPIENLGSFDAVFLRNVLIYFDSPTKVAVVDRVLTQLKPGGLFFLGTAEGRVPCQTPLQVVQPGVFRKSA